MSDVELLKRIIKYEEQHIDEWRAKEKQFKEEYGEDIKYGWSWSDVGIHPSKLQKLLLDGWIEVTYKSRSRTEYRLVDFERAKQYVEMYMGIQKAESVQSGTADIDEVFKNIVGYEDVKEIFRLALKAERPVHILLIGSPATAKSLFLLEIGKLQGAVYVTGSGASSAGIEKILVEKRPNYLCIDEIDKLKSSDDLSVLLSLMETGRVIRAKADWQADITLNTKVFAAGNVLNLPGELADRFVILKFKEYSKEEFERICVHYFTKEEGVAEDVVRKVVDRVWQYDRSIRTVRSVLRLTGGDASKIDMVLDTLSKYK